jgi:hypothetical protein
VRSFASLGRPGLRSVKGFHDGKLSGKLMGMRSSHLSVQWRLLYRVQADAVIVHVERISPGLPTLKRESTDPEREGKR